MLITKIQEVDLTLSMFIFSVFSYHANNYVTKGDGDLLLMEAAAE